MGETKNAADSQSTDLAMESVDTNNDTGEPLVGLLQIEPATFRGPTLHRAYEKSERLSKEVVEIAPIVAVTDPPAVVVEANSSEPTSTQDGASKSRTTEPHYEQPASRRIDNSIGSSGPEQDIKKVVGEEIAAALKRNDEEIESQLQSRIEQEMSSRLAQFGFTNSQVDTMVSPGIAANLPQTPNPSGPFRPDPPTYAKIQKQYLDIETLLYYDIPFEYGTDLDYIITLREMSQVETDILFEHTRRRREDILTECVPPGIL